HCDGGKEHGSGTADLCVAGHPLARCGDCVLTLPLRTAGRSACREQSPLVESVMWILGHRDIVVHAIETHIQAGLAQITRVISLVVTGWGLACLMVRDILVLTADDAIVPRSRRWHVAVRGKRRWHQTEQGEHGKQGCKLFHRNFSFAIVYCLCLSNRVGSAPQGPTPCLWHGALACLGKLLCYLKLCVS